MRSLNDAARIEQLMQGIGRLATGPGRVYLIEGACAVTIGWRQTTVDADLKLDPEPGGVFEAIAKLKDALDMNVELAAPDDFIPPLPGWRERSPFIARHGQVDFFHYDFCAQALAKIERGHTTDLEDVRQMIGHALVDTGELARRFDMIAPDMIRYPAIDPDVFRAKVERFINDMRGAMGDAHTPDDTIPGADLVQAGLKALDRGEWSIEALLVAVGAPRLRALGIAAPDAGRLPHHPEIALYRAIGREHPGDTHSRYNALIRRLISFERELERREYSALRRGHAANGQASQARE